MEISKINETKRTITGLRNALFIELDNFRKGKLNHKEAVAIARIADSIIKSVRLEMDVYRHPLSKAYSLLPDYPELDITCKSEEIEDNGS